MNRSYRRSRYSGYRGMNSYKATHPTKENAESHIDEKNLTIDPQTAVVLPWYNIEDGAKNPDSQDDIKNTDKELGSFVSIGSRVNGIMASIEIKPSVITPQDLITANISIGSSFMAEFLNRLKNTIDHFGAEFAGKTEKDLYGDWRLTEGSDGGDSTNRDVSHSVIYPDPFTPAGKMLDYFYMGQAKVGFSKLREHTLYGWRPMKQRGFVRVPSKFKRVGLDEAFALFIWNRSDDPLNVDILKRFTEYKEV